MLRRDGDGQLPQPPDDLQQFHDRGQLPHRGQHLLDPEQRQLRHLGRDLLDLHHPGELPAERGDLAASSVQRHARVQLLWQHVGLQRRVLDSEGASHVLGHHVRLQRV